MGVVGNYALLCVGPLTDVLPAAPPCPLQEEKKARKKAEKDAKKAEKERKVGRDR